MNRAFATALCALTLTAQVAGMSFAGTNLRGSDGRPRSLKDLRSGIVVVNFWATWCAPCRKEMPVVNQLSDRYEKVGVRFIGVSVDEPSTENQIEEFTQQLSIRYEVWRGATAADMDQMGFPFAIPSTAILQNGRIVDRVTGDFKQERLMRKIDELLAKPLRP